MKRLTALLTLTLIGLPFSCDSPVTEPETFTSPSQIQLSIEPLRGFALSKYLQWNPLSYGTKVYLAPGEGMITSEIVGEETVPYSPPMVGSKMTFGDISWVLASHQESLFLLRIGDYLFSRDCQQVSSYPESAVIGHVHDGMIIDLTGGERLWQVNPSDPSDCRELNTGESDSYVFLIQVQDVRLPDRHVSENWPGHREDMKWHTYKDAILMWELEPNLEIPFMLELGQIEELLGIQPPTSADTNGWAVDDVLIWGKNVGLLFQGDVELGTGAFEVDLVLMSQGPQGGE